ncbi:hypothetical protein HDU87_005822 [Geranomyces variabilis]|uniref:F-box domain-containing protein n=1 Tax=Geranomyces variabilis TaxID=109894 RepID=A0AAD5XPC3_9FUNG|nr:hypothetical protein HDU87_005822 [Geranomyces variabilis]
MDLPEIAVRVFEYLDPAGIARSHRVCRSWHAVLLNNVNAVWENSAARMSPIPGVLPKRCEWETWQDVVRLKYCWGVVLPRMAKESREEGETAAIPVAMVPTSVAGIKAQSRVTVLDSYDSGSYSTVRGSVHTQQTGRHVFFTETQNKNVRVVDISEDTDSPLGVPHVIEASKSATAWRLQRAVHSDLVPCHESNGWMSFWYADSRTRAGRVRAIEDEYCQGQLYGRSYACFNPRWSDEPGDNTDAAHAVRMWDLSNPDEPFIKWEAKTAAHIVDVAQNGMLVAIAYGSLLDDDDDNAGEEYERPDSVFGLEFRSSETGELIRRCHDSNWQDIIFLICTRTHCLCVRALEDGQIVTIVDLATGLVVSEFDLRDTFTRNYGGLHLNEDETMLMLWASSNDLAVLDLLTGTSVIAARKRDDDLYETWRKGIWIVMERENARKERPRFVVMWKALAAKDEVKSYSAM